MYYTQPFSILYILRNFLNREILKGRFGSFIAYRDPKNYIRGFRASIPYITAAPPRRGARRGLPITNERRGGDPSPEGGGLYAVGVCLSEGGGDADGGHTPVHVTHGAVGVALLVCAGDPLNLTGLQVGAGGEGEDGHGVSFELREL